MLLDVMALGAVAASLRKTEFGAKVVDQVSEAASSTYNTVAAAANTVAAAAGYPSDVTEEGMDGAVATPVPSLSVRPQARGTCGAMPLLRCVSVPWALPHCWHSLS